MFRKNAWWLGFWIFLLGMPSVAFSAVSSFLDYPFLYKGPRSLGMGGAYTAVGQDAEGLFYNPATLHDMGFQLQVLNPYLEVGQGVLDLYRDLLDTLDIENDTERIDALFNLLRSNQGTPLHLRTGMFPHVAVGNLAVGVLGQARGDVRLHNPLSSTGAVETHAGFEYGLVAGFSFQPPFTGLRIGIGGKWIQRSWLDKNFTIADVAREEFNFSQEKVDAADFSLDLGLIYDLPVAPALNPKVGIALLDMTDLDFGKAGKIPQRLNLGFSLNPRVPYLASLILALDLQDVTRAFEQDDSWGKRLHLGAEAGVLGNHLRFRLGIHQGYRTFGAGLDIWVLKIEYANYHEEIGAYAGQDRDRRQIVQVILGW